MDAAPNHLLKYPSGMGTAISWAKGPGGVSPRSCRCTTRPGLATSLAPCLVMSRTGNKARQASSIASRRSWNRATAVTRIGTTWRKLSRTVESGRVSSAALLGSLVKQDHGSKAFRADVTRHFGVFQFDYTLRPIVLGFVPRTGPAALQHLMGVVARSLSAEVVEMLIDWRAWRDVIFQQNQSSRCDSDSSAATPERGNDSRSFGPIVTSLFASHGTPWPSAELTGIYFRSADVSD